MRRPTFIAIVVLFVLLIAAGIAQLSERAPSTLHPGPTSPGQLPPHGTSSASP